MSAEPRNVPSSRRSYRQVARARSAAATRARVLAVAEALVGEPGRLTLEAAARGARTTVPTVLRHFGSRDALEAAALGAALSRVRTARPRVPDGDARAAARALAAEYEAHPGLLRAAEAAPAGAARELEAAHRLHRDWLARAFARALSPLPPAVHRRRLAQLVAVSGPTPWRALRETEHLGPEQAAAALAEVLRALTR